ncbi:MAG: hypothetical protein Q6360_13140 [Candidatus Brocadiales bacterium]|nr:hypothetical protein [Candidatus Brocadiales bacterium]
MKSGYIYEAPVINKDYVFGSAHSVETQKGASLVLQPDGQWDDYLPEKEYQFNQYFDTISCVSFTTLSCVEILFERQFGKEMNYSDRFLSKVSGTTKQGNSPQRPAETLRTGGIVEETLWPFSPNLKTWEEFMSDIPRGLFILAKDFLKQYVFAHEYVPSNAEKMKDALTHSPLGVSVAAWFKGEDGFYYKPDGTSDSHFTIVYGYEDGKYWKCFDSYNVAGEDNSVLKKIKWNTPFEVVKRYGITENTEELKKTVSLLQHLYNALKELIEAMFPRPAYVTPPQELPMNKTDYVQLMAEAIANFESGGRLDSLTHRLNNPGAIKDKKGNFIVFKNYAEGFEYLRDYIRRACTGRHPAYKPSMTINQFFHIYAPDPEPIPTNYANTVAKHMGVYPSFTLREVFHK